MILAILLLFIFAATLLVINIKNKHTWMFVLVALSIDTLMLSMLLFVGKLANYYSVWDFENKIYLWINSRKIGFYEVVSIENFGIFIYMVSMWAFINFLYPRKKEIKSRIYSGIFTIIPALFFLVLNSPAVCRRLHTYIYATENVSIAPLLLVLLQVLRWLNYSAVVYYILYPVIKILIGCRHTNIMYKKRNMAVIAITLCLMNVFFVYMLYMSTFGFSLLDMTNLLKFSGAYLVYSPVMYTVIPFIVLIVFEGTLILFMRYKVLERVDFFKKTTISKRTRLLFSDIRPVLHSYKNILLSIMFLGESAKEGYGTDSGLQDVDEIIKMSSEAGWAMTNLLNVFSVSQISVDDVDLGKCIKDALKDACCSSHVTVENKAAGKKVTVLGDKAHIKRMFENIFYNAIEAIGGNKNGKIEVSIDSELEWQCVRIRDNGCGIAKKDIKKIFKPLFSTKKTSKNWGIGLSYVYRVVEAHNGLIFVSSEVGKYTEFQILLPTMREISLDE